ncbi:MAG: adenylate/guanylate cyclase domain-containing protein, partial [Myxococcales bacterium]
MANCERCGFSNPLTARYCSQCAEPLVAKAAGVPAAPAGVAGERRQLTVLFCDLVGSSALAERLDGEDLEGLLSVYHRTAAEVVERFGGHVAQYLGDGMLIYFGYPLAHEDSPRRAV